MEQDSGSVKGLGANCQCGSYGTSTTLFIPKTLTADTFLEIAQKKKMLQVAASLDYSKLC